MNIVASVGDDRDVQTRADEPKHPHAALTVILACVLAKQRRVPIDVRDQLERQASSLNVQGVLGWIERQPHLIYRYSRK